MEKQSIKIRHPFRQKDLDWFEKWVNQTIPTMDVIVHEQHRGNCYFEAKSEDPLDFYKLGIFCATHLQILEKKKLQRKQLRQQQDN
jgi:hypothetical protein